MTLDGQWMYRRTLNISELESKKSKSKWGKWKTMKV